MKYLSLVTLSLVLSFAFPLAAMAQKAEPSSPQVAVMFDTDRNILLKDSDGDGVPDLTESLEGTDLLNPSSFLGADTQ